jgi:cell division protein ZapA
LQENYTVRDKQDLLSMCVLQFATRMLNAERQSQNHEVGLEIQYRNLISC